jgi:hypothetical protein
MSLLGHGQCGEIKALLLRGCNSDIVKRSSLSGAVGLLRRIHRCKQ